jgi:serine/threonine-protein kinase
MHPEGIPGQAAHDSGLPKIGETLGGKYQIVRLLGEGGMAFVYEASHQRLQQRVAIKMLTPEFARDPELVSRFEREARAVARLRTKHVTRVMDGDTTPGGIPYIVMEFLEGRDLDAELQARTLLPLGEAVDYVLQTCACLLEAHNMGIVHRDLKPANLFLATERDGGDGDGRIVKVLDFGISKVVGEATRLTGAGAVMGTVLYMSPEQVRAQPNVDTRADIWALGVILYELLAGRAPWDGHSHQIAAAIVAQDPPDLRTFVAVPDGIATVVRTMLQRDPAQRFAGVREVIASLAPFAPPGSIGGAVAEQIALGQSGSRARGSGGMPNAIVKHTVPMGSRPSALDAASAAARAAYGPPPHGPAPGGPTHAGVPRAADSARSLAAAAGPMSRAPISAGGRSRARLVLTFAIVIGLVGVAGIGLIVVASLHKAPARPAAADAAAAAPSSGSSASSSRVTSEPPVKGSAEMTSAMPPSTGTVRRTSPSAESSSGRAPGTAAVGPGTPPRRDGGANRPAAPASTGLPSFL